MGPLSRHHVNKMKFGFGSTAAVRSQPRPILVLSPQYPRLAMPRIDSHLKPVDVAAPGECQPSFRVTIVGAEAV
jgi:hypothetical protein